MFTNGKYSNSLTKSASLPLCPLKGGNVASIYHLFIEESLFTLTHVLGFPTLMNGNVRIQLIGGTLVQYVWPYFGGYIPLNGPYIW